ncbi:MAG: acyltransferase domain-containing protein, partial [Candidatus Thiodiazotropha sp.]
MCKELMNTEPVFRKAIEQIDEHLQPLANWSIEDKFEADTDYSDPFLNHIAIFSVQIGLSELWKSLGVFPDEIIGQSVGEVAAAYVSGGLTLKDAVKVIYYRSKHLAEQRGGAMMVVGNYGIEKLEKLCDQYDRKVVVAVYSSPTACTLSGDRATMQKIKECLEKEAETESFKILLKELNVQCAYHSSHVENCLSAIKNDIGELSGRDETIPHISTVTGEEVPQNTFQSPDYWTDNVRKPVLFMQAVQAASHNDTTNVFLEIGPKQVLRAHISTFLDHKSNIALPSMGYQKECSLILDSLSVLYQMGHNVDWDKFYVARGYIVPIPKYVFNKTKMLYYSEPQQRYFKGMPSEDGAIGQHMFLRSSASENADYKMTIDKKSTPYVYDHFLHNTILVPGATYVEAAFDIGHRSSESSANELSVSVEFINPLTPSGDKQYQ